MLMSGMSATQTEAEKLYLNIYNLRMLTIAVINMKANHLIRPGTKFQQIVNFSTVAIFY